MNRDHPQRDAFRSSEGDAYYARNRSAHSDLASAIERDPLLCAIRDADVAPRRVLEVGAGDGWRLAALGLVHPDAELAGVEPSRTAVAAGRALHPRVTLLEGTADSLPFDAGRFDLVLFGFCLYLCDRADLFRVAAEADRVLAADGVIGVYDFHAEVAYRNPYVHHSGLSSYKMDHARLFDWNPAFRTIYRRVLPHPTTDGLVPTKFGADDLVAVTLLQRDLERAWPLRSTSPTPAR